jgi:hypothetical protein
VEPPPDLFNGEEEYEVESFMSHQKRSKGTQYLVKWKGYLMSDNSWEPEGNLKHMQQILMAYKCRHHL